MFTRAQYVPNKKIGLGEGKDGSVVAAHWCLVGGHVFGDVVVGIAIVGYKPHVHE